MRSSPIQRLDPYLLLYIFICGIRRCRLVYVVCDNINLYSRISECIVMCDDVMRRRCRLLLSNPNRNQSLFPFFLFYKGIYKTRVVELIHIYMVVDFKSSIYIYMRLFSISKYCLTNGNERESE